MQTKVNSRFRFYFTLTEVVSVSMLQVYVPVIPSYEGRCLMGNLRQARLRYEAATQHAILACDVERLI